MHISLYCSLLFPLPFSSPFSLLCLPPSSPLSSSAFFPFISLFSLFLLRFTSSLFLSSFSLPLFPPPFPYCFSLLYLPPFSPSRYLKMWATQVCWKKPGWHWHQGEKYLCPALQNAVLGVRHLFKFVPLRCAPLFLSLCHCTTAPLFQLKFLHHCIGAHATVPHFEEQFTHKKIAPLTSVFQIIIAHFFNYKMYLSLVTCHLSQISCLTSPFSWLTSPVSHLLSYIFCLLSPVSCAKHVLRLHAPAVLHNLFVSLLLSPKI